MYHSRCYIGHGSGTHIREIHEKLFGYGRRQPCLDKQAQPLLVSKGSFIFPYDLPSCVFSAYSPIFFLSLSLRPGRNLIAFRHFPYSPFENVPTQKQGKSSDNVGEMKKRSCRVSPKPPSAQLAGLSKSNIGALESENQDYRPHSLI
jgi:hypothetical protein